MKKKKESVIKRMLRGFKFMYNKLANSNYVQNMKENEKSADPNEFMPVGFEQEESKEDPFATKF